MPLLLVPVLVPVEERLMMTSLLLLLLVLMLAVVVVRLLRVQRFLARLLRAAQHIR